MRPKQERRHDAEVAAASANRPEEVFVLARACGDQVAGGQQDVGLEQIVEGQPELASQVAHATAKCQPGDPGRPEDARRDGEPERVSRVIEIGQGAARLYPHGPLVRVDPDPAQASEVDDESVVDRPEARAMVAAPSDRDLQSEVDPELERQPDVSDIDWPGDERRPSIHGGIEHSPRIVVARVVAPDHLSSEACLQRGEGRLVERRGSKRRCHVTPPLSGHRR